jgi:YfiR/HmsC-like
LALGLITLTLTLARTQAQPSLTEAQAKAGFILNFARYVEWPATAFGSREAPVLACLLERDALVGALTALEGRLVQGRPLKVRRSLSAEDTQGCHLVFIGEAEERRIVPLLRALAGQPVLTVGDADRFVDLGGAIGIVLGEERLQFEVNRAALEQAQLKAGASLLKLARSVVGTEVSR